LAVNRTVVAPFSGSSDHQRASAQFLMVGANSSLSSPSTDGSEFMYKSGRTLQIVRLTGGKDALAAVLEFLKIFVRDLYANRAIVEFGTFPEFTVSVT
jgi:hypothetical protein